MARVFLTFMRRLLKTGQARQDTGSPDRLQGAFEEVGVAGSTTGRACLPAEPAWFRGGADSTVRRQSAAPATSG